MIEINPLKECTYEQALDAWNKGFEGYSIDIQMNMEKFLSRLVNEGLSVEHSFVAFEGDKPVGIVLNGVEERNGKRFAWNGGTGVSKEKRSQGVGKQLIEHALQIYKQDNIDVALLESIRTNEPAKKLYEKMGYQVVDEVSFLQAEKLECDAFCLDNDLDERSAFVGEVKELSFYNDKIPWQNQLNRLKQANFTIILQEGKAVAYFVTKNTVDEKGNIRHIALYQLEIKDDIRNKEQVINHALACALKPEIKCGRMTVNFSKKNALIINKLKEVGFSNLLEQVSMERKMK